MRQKIEVIFRLIGSIHEIQKCKFGIRDININLFLDATVWSRVNYTAGVMQRSWINILYRNLVVKQTVHSITHQWKVRIIDSTVRIRQDFKQIVTIWGEWQSKIVKKRQKVLILMWIIMIKIFQKYQIWFIP